MASSVPTLSSVRTNRYEMGRDAATMAIEAIEGRRPEQPVVDLGFTRDDAAKFGSAGLRPPAPAVRGASPNKTE